MSWFGTLLDDALHLRHTPPVIASGRIFRPTRRSLLYELAGWAVVQSAALFFVLLLLFGAPVVEAFAWTGWIWPLELALQWSTWVERLILRSVPDAWHMLVSALGMLAFISQLLLTLVGIWASHRYAWVVANGENLRLYQGGLNIHDVTMRYAVVQQVRLRQGPMQRLFGIGDVEISSAAGQDDEAGGSRMVRVRNIARSTELRDLVRSRAEATRRLPSPPDVSDAQVAAAELLQAARELRIVLER